MYTIVYCNTSLKEQNSLNSFFAIVLALGNIAVSRLTLTWEVSQLTAPRGEASSIPLIHVKYVY